tara:strand:- start:199 stop:1599 length:1401 start_codon:yes stop_codon:yes gene_type:complete
MVQNLELNESGPFSVEAERAVIGGIMFKNNAYDLVASVVDVEDFHLKQHKLIFQTIKNLHDQGKPIDLITVQETLQGNGDLSDLNELGGINYLTQLAKQTFTIANIESYAEIVKQRSNLKKLIDTTEDISQQARQSYSSNSDQVIDRAEERILSLRDDMDRSSGPRGIRDLLPEFTSELEKLTELEKNSLIGVSSGFSQIDKMTLGFQKQDLIIIAGRPSMGKTSLALNIAENVAKEKEKNQKVLIFSMEMSAEQIVRRFVSSHTKIDIQDLMKGNIDEEDWKLIYEAFDFIQENNILIDDTPSLDPSELRSKSRRIKRENQDLALIVVDYIGLMQVQSRNENRVAEISEISRSLKSLAKELNLPILALSQLNRAIETRTDKRPLLSDLRDSGAIEQDADVIAFLYRHDFYEADTDLEISEADVYIAKQRNGPTGSLKLLFNKTIAKFEEKSYREPPPDISETGSL